MSLEYIDFYCSLNEFEKKFAPDKIYHAGDLDLLFNGLKISIVGSRKVSEEGKKRTKLLAKSLVEKGVTIVSGMAEGVDTIAHTTAMNNSGKTIAVVGTPLDKVYPKSNAELYSQIATNHLAISQFPSGYPFKKENFPRRNRTMALISDATIIVEASEKSGTRHQGWEALRLGRPLYILQNVVKDNSITWANEMLNYGAKVLTRESLENLTQEVPDLSLSLNLQI